MPQRISACLIVKNEAAVITEALESVAPWVDEIVVVDTGSTDATIAAVKAFGITSYHFKWIDDFSAARNFSISKATGDWILWLDADDVIPPETGGRLRLLASSAKPQVGGYIFKYYYPSRASSRMEDGISVQRLALFRNQPELRFRYRVHEVIDLALLEAGLEIVTLDLSIYHQNYTQDQAVIDAKNKKYLEIIKQEMAGKKDDIRHWHNIIMTYRALRDYETVTHYGDEFLRIARDLPDPTGGHTNRLYGWIAEAYVIHDRQEEAIAVLQQALQQFPKNPDYLIWMANAYIALGKNKEARECALVITHSEYEQMREMTDQLNIVFWPYHILGYLATEEKNWSMAKNYLEYAQKIYPNTNTAILLLGVYKNMHLEGKFEETKQKLLQHEPEAYERYLATAGDIPV